jgi:myo-inositol-1(or 4)-monophosphatase
VFEGLGAAGHRVAFVTEGELRDSVHFAAGIALRQVAGCIITGRHGQPLHTGTDGLVAAADQHTHLALIRVIEHATTPAQAKPGSVTRANGNVLS